MTLKSVYFGALLEQRLSRRGFLVASGAAAATGALPALGAGADTTRSAKAKSYAALTPSREDALRLSPGLRSQVVVGFGDPLFDGDPGLTAGDLRTLDWLDRDAATRQERRFGTNNDALAFFPMRGRRNAGLLCANPE
jgi:secreted PhoX family phosphatase